MRALGIEPAVLLPRGIEVRARGREVGGVALGHAMDVQALRPRGKALGRYLDLDALGLLGQSGQPDLLSYVVPEHGLSATGRRIHGGRGAATDHEDRDDDAQKPLHASPLSS